MISRLIMRIPLIRRPFHQRDTARRERDAAQRQLQEMQTPKTQSFRSQSDMAASFGYNEFYWHPEQDAKQDQVVGDFRDFIRRSVAKDQPAVEVGPSLRPIIPKRLGFDVTIVDHADETAIAAKYASQGLDTSEIEPVDVVWTGDKLAEAMPHRNMAAIVACHMIEHATDFIGFLNDCTDMLAVDGQILLIIPDRRYCFDFFHPSSDVGKVIDDHQQQRRLHSFQSLFRNTTNIGARIDGATVIAWGQHELEDVVLMNGDPERGLHFLSSETSEYVDSHENYFTPSSFVLLLEELRYLGILQLAPRIVTRARNCEFLIVLDKATQLERATLTTYLQRKKFLILNMLREERERLQFLSALLDG
jgi:hypothetical protein